MKSKKKTTLETWFVKVVEENVGDDVDEEDAEELECSNLKRVREAIIQALEDGYRLNQIVIERRETTITMNEVVQAIDVLNG